MIVQLHLTVLFHPTILFHPNHPVPAYWLKDAYSQLTISSVLLMQASMQQVKVQVDTPLPPPSTTNVEELQKLQRQLKELNKARALTDTRWQGSYFSPALPDSAAVRHAISLLSACHMPWSTKWLPLFWYQVWRVAGISTRCTAGHASST